MKHADKIAADPRTLALESGAEGHLLTLRVGWSVDGLHRAFFRDIRQATAWLRRAEPCALRGPLPDLIGWTCMVPAVAGHDKHAWRAIIIEQHDTAVVARCLTGAFENDRWVDLKFCHRFLSRTDTEPPISPYLL